MSASKRDLPRKMSKCWGAAGEEQLGRGLAVRGLLCGRQEARTPRAPRPAASSPLSCACFPEGSSSPYGDPFTLVTSLEAPGPNTVARGGVRQARERTPTLRKGGRAQAVGRTARPPGSLCRPLASRLSGARVAAGCGPSGGHRAALPPGGPPGCAGPCPRRFFSPRGGRQLPLGFSRRPGPGRGRLGLAGGPGPTRDPRREGQPGPRNPRSRLPLSHGAGQAPWLADSEPRGARLSHGPDARSAGPPSPVRAPPAGRAPMTRLAAGPRASHSPGVQPNASLPSQFELLLPGRAPPAPGAVSAWERAARETRSPAPATPQRRPRGRGSRAPQGVPGARLRPAPSSPVGYDWLQLRGTKKDGSYLSHRSPGAHGPRAGPCPRLFHRRLPPHRHPAPPPPAESSSSALSGFSHVHAFVHLPRKTL